MPGVQSNNIPRKYILDATTKCIDCLTQGDDDLSRRLDEVEVRKKKRDMVVHMMV